MVTGKNTKGAEGNLMNKLNDQITINPLLGKEPSAAIINNKTIPKEDCGKFNRCKGYKLLNL
jgi:hypothetical protein